MLKSTHPTAAATGTRRTRPRLSSWGDSAICFAANARGEEAKGERIVLAIAKFLANGIVFSGSVDNFEVRDVGFKDEGSLEALTTHL